MNSKCCIRNGYTLKEAIEIIDDSKDRVAIVLDQDDVVVGVVSQGDIIRAIISGKELFARVETIVRPNFYYLNDVNMEKAYDLFKKNKITLLPIVDNDFKLKTTINMDDIYRYLEELCEK